MHDADEPTLKPVYPYHYNQVPGKADIHMQKVQATCLHLRFGYANCSHDYS